MWNFRSFNLINTTNLLKKYHYSINKIILNRTIHIVNQEKKEKKVNTLITENINKNKEQV